MIINENYFNSLGLEFGDYICLMIETGEMFFGLYHGDFDGQGFYFYSHSTGNEIRIILDKLQRLERAG